MDYFEVVFYPGEGDRDSPVDVFVGLPEPKRAAIRHRLDRFEELPIQQWPSSWVKAHTESIWQLRVGDYRVMYVLDRPYLVVLHIFLKQGRKTSRRDLHVAQRNYDRYTAEDRG